MTEKIKYTVGFALSSNKAIVALITKNRPQWQNGLLNGIGGHLEEGETPHECMKREFYEEAGLELDNWQQFCEIEYNDCIVYFFKHLDVDLTKLETKTDEKIGLYYIASLVAYKDKLIPNLHWLIQMAKFDDSFYYKIDASN